VEVSQPLVALPSQLTNPALQLASAVVLHAPAAQAASPLATPHARPHAPQWRGSAAVVTQVDAQRVAPAGQVVTQAPATHAVMPTQARPQAPQCAALVRVSVSQPLWGSPSQSADPVAQVGTHTPAAQVLVGVVAPVVHARPQAPQWAAVARVSASQPLRGSPSQSAKPAAHTGSQTPATQALARVPAFVAQATPQPPQCSALVCASTHEPPHEVRSGAQAHRPITQL
jgi:hypothetical protein